MNFLDWLNKNYPHHKAIDVISGEVCAQRMQEAYEARGAEVERLKVELAELTASYNKLCDETRWQGAELSALKQGVEVESVIYHSCGHAGLTIHNLSRKKYKVGAKVVATVRLKEER